MRILKVLALMMLVSATIFGQAADKSKDETITGSWTFNKGGVQASFINPGKPLERVEMEWGRLAQYNEAGTVNNLFRGYGDTYLNNIVGNVGIGTTSPETILHVEGSNIGVRSNYSTVLFESKDCHLDLTSSSADKWGSSLNFVEGNGNTNTDIWSIIRQTTGGAGNSSLCFHFGSDNNVIVNRQVLQLSANGNIGVGINPSAKLDVNGTTIIRDRLQIGGTLNAWTNDIINGYTNGMNPTDGAILVPIHKSSASDLRLYIPDDGNDAFSIWGATCAGGDCQDLNEAQQVVRFEGGGNVRYYGKVGIGKSASSNTKLDVAGNIKAQEIEVTLASIDNMQLNGTLAANNITLTTNGNTADFVFSDSYQLRNLSEVESFIKTNKHLPEIPSATQMEEQGVNLAEMNKLLLQKVEELTLYAIQQEAARKKEQGEREKLNAALSQEQSARSEMEERLAKLEALLLNAK